MTQRLPIPGQDDGTWGNILNGYLGVAHNPDGTLIPSAVTAAGAGTYSKPVSGIPSTDLDTPTQTTLTAVASKYTKPGGGIPGSDIANTTITDANISASAAIARTKLDSSTQASLNKADNAPTTLAALTDVSGASGATNTQVLAYNSSTSHWIPSTVTSTTVSDATTGVKGIVQLAGDLAGTAAAPTVPGLATTEKTANKGTASGYASLNSSTVVPTTQLGSGTASTSTYLRGDSSWATVPASATNATISAPGLVQLAGDLAGTASAPTVAKVNGVTLPAGSPSSGNVLTALTSTTTAWSTPAAGVTIDATSADIIADSVTGSGVAGSVGKAADAGHQHPLVAHDHTTANKGGQIPVGGLSATGTASASTYLRGDGSWTIPAAGVALDSTSADIQPLGVQAAGSLGTAAKADHIHAMPRLDQVSTPSTAVAFNAQKITGLANGTAATDAAAFGQIPVAGTTTGTYAAGNDARLTAATNAAVALNPTNTKTSAYTAAAADYVPVDISAGSLTVTLPTAPADKTQVGVKITKVSATPGSTTLTISVGGSDVFNVTGGSTSLILSAKFQGVILQYQTSTAIWYVQTTDIPLNVPLGAGLVGSDGTLGGPSGTPLSSSVVTNVTRSISSNYTLIATDHVILADATSAGFTITLPTAVGYIGRYTIDAITSTANLVTVVTSSSQTIDGVSTTTVGTQASGATWSSVDLISDGSNWRSV